MCLKEWRIICGAMKRLLPPLFMLLTTACGEASKPADAPVETTDGPLPSALIAVDVRSRNSDEPWPYAKPGAAVRFFHDYRGGAQPGETTLVALSFAERYAAGKLIIQLEPMPGLQMSPGQRQYAYDLSAQDPIEIGLALGAAVAGKYYLNIFASVTDVSGRMQSRVFALGFQVGKAVVDRGRSAQKLTDGDAVIVLPIIE